MPAALDLELIKTFLTVWDARGFKAAAERLNKTPAAVSMQIKRLEELLGKRLLERSNQGISLTTAGELLREKGQALLSLNYELLGEFREDEPNGQLNFGTPADYAPTLLKEILPIFLREFPKVSPNIVLEPSRLLRPRLKAGTLDSAIVAREIGEQEGIALWSEQITWFGPAYYPEELPRVGLLLADCMLRDQAIEQLKQLPTGYNVVLQAATVAALRDAVEAGFCHAFLPISVGEGLPISASPFNSTPFELNFCLIPGPHFDTAISERIAKKFRRDQDN